MVDDSPLKNMKKKLPKKSVPLIGQVILKYLLPSASSVSVSGSFNNWVLPGVSLYPAGDGYWALNFDLAPGRYEFRLLVDGAWADVPNATETVENPFGSRNAVLIVELPA